MIISYCGGLFLYVPNAIKSTKRKDFEKYLLDEVDWKQEKIQTWNGYQNAPRLNYSWSEDGVTYKYSGRKFYGRRYTQEIRQLRGIIREIIKSYPEFNFIRTELMNAPFNYCLGNLYQNGYHSLSYHSDDETDIEKNSAIVGFTFGQPRPLRIIPKKKPATGRRKSIVVTPVSGSVYFMMPGFQDEYEHAIPKVDKEVSPRASLTFRSISNN